MRLACRSTRFNEIKRQLSGVTQRVLTQTLRRLERNGMITRRVIPTSPIGVKYALTPLGESLREPFGRLYDWTIEHAATIRAAQADYDEGHEMSDVVLHLLSFDAATQGNLRDYGRHRHGQRDVLDGWNSEKEFRDAVGKHHEQAKVEVVVPDVGKEEGSGQYDYRVESEIQRFHDVSVPV
jgi:DNA-binding HxlR family transcriptional regulator